MKSRTLTYFIATLFAVLALPLQLAAQHTRYKLIDIGTFGGPASYFTDPGIGPGSQVLSNRGMLAGKADTSTPDSSSNNCPPICFDTHVFRWDKVSLPIWERFQAAITAMSAGSMRVAGSQEVRKPARQIH